MHAPWDIVHVDLSEGVPLLNVTPSVQGAFVVFWWRHIPLGHRKIEAARLPISIAQLAHIALQEIVPVVKDYASEQQVDISSLAHSARHLSTADADIDVQTHLEEVLAVLDYAVSRFPTPEGQVDASIGVIIPTYNRPSGLAACLRSLQALRLTPQEIVVVDNAPQSITTRSLVGLFPNVRYVAESRQGASAARNTGVRHSKARIVAFVDDDETVHPDWLTWLKHCFRDPCVAVATGLVLPAALQTQAQCLFESRFSFIRGYCGRIFDRGFFERTKSRGVPVWHIGGSGNMAIRRDVFERSGGFDDRLGAGRAGCSEDSELFYRVLTHGWHCAYEPRAVSYHHHRRDMHSLKRQLFFYMRGHVAALLVQYAKHKDRGNLHRLFWTLPKAYGTYCLLSLVQDPAFRPSMLRAEIAGYLSGWRFYLRHRASAHME